MRREVGGDKKVEVGGVDDFILAGQSRLIRARATEDVALLALLCLTPFV